MKHLLRTLFCLACLLLICSLPCVKKAEAAQTETTALTENSAEDTIFPEESETESDMEQAEIELSAQWTPGEQTAVAIIAMLSGILVSYMMSHRKPRNPRGGKPGSKTGKSGSGSKTGNMRSGKSGGGSKPGNTRSNKPGSKRKP